MKLHNLVKTCRGKDSIVMTDSLPKVRDRMNQLRASQRNGIKGQKVEYKIVPADINDEKFKQKPLSESWRSGGSAQIPPRVK